MNVHVSPQAMRDVADASEWYGNRDPRLEDDFLAELDSALADIETDPTRFPEVELSLPAGRTIRRKILNRFKYLVVFEVTTNEVRVLAVSHPSRNPTWWTDRL